MSCPKAQTRPASGSAARSAPATSGSFTFAVWCSSMPSSRARLGGRRRAQLRPAPGAPVGRRDDQRRPVRRPASAAARSPRTRRSRGRRCATRALRPWRSRRRAVTPTSESSSAPGGSELSALAQRPQRALALLARGAVEDQHAVEVVDLVLEHARLEPEASISDRLAARVEAADPHVQRALDVDRDAGQAEAALLGGGHLLGEPLDLGVDDAPSAARRGRPGRRAAGAGSRAGSPPGRRPSRRASARPSARPPVRASASNSVTGGARLRPGRRTCDLRERRVAPLEQLAPRCSSGARGRPRARSARRRLTRALRSQPTSLRREPLGPALPTAGPRRRRPRRP